MNYSSETIRLKNADKVPYLTESFMVLKRLIGFRIRNLYRVSDSRDDEALCDLTPIIIEINQGDIICFDVDEGMSNVFLFDSAESSKRIKNILHKYPHRLNIVNQYKCLFWEQVDFDSEITNIEIIGKDHEFVGWYLMSGVGFTLESGFKLVIGTALTDLEIQGVWVLKTDELSQGWNSIELAKLL